MKNHIPKIILFDETVWKISLKNEIFMDYQQLVCFQPGRTEEIWGKKSDFSDLRNLKLKFIHKSKSHPVYLNNYS